MTSDIGDRLKNARRELGLNATEMAEKVGLSGRSSWERYERGKHSPNGEILRHLADLGFNVNWVLTGYGPMMVEEVPHPPAVTGLVDQALMGRCSDAFGKLYKEMGITLSMADLGSLAAQAYNDLAAAGAEDMDIPTQHAMIRLLTESHRREILAESAANAKGKRSAS